MAVPKPSRRRSRPFPSAPKRQRRGRDRRRVESATWRTRQPSTNDEEFWTIVFAVVFAAWALVLVLWALHEHPSWLVGRRGRLFGGGAPIGLMVFGTYVPVAVGAWRLLYPASRHLVPWAWVFRRDRNEPDDSDDGDPS